MLAKYKIFKSFSGFTEIIYGAAALLLTLYALV